MMQRCLSNILGSDSRSSKDSNRLGYYVVSNDTKLLSFRKFTVFAKTIDLTYTIYSTNSGAAVLFGLLGPEFREITGL